MRTSSGPSARVFQVHVHARPRATANALKVDVPTYGTQAPHVGSPGQPERDAPDLRSDLGQMPDPPSNALGRLLGVTEATKTEEQTMLIQQRGIARAKRLQRRAARAARRPQTTVPWPPGGSLPFRYTNY